MSTRNKALWATYTDQDLAEMKQEFQLELSGALTLQSKKRAEIYLTWIEEEQKLRVGMRRCDECGRPLTKENNSVGSTCDSCLADEAAEHNNSFHTGEY